MTSEEAREALVWWRGGVCDHGAAEEALRIVAGLRYEYAVQVKGGWWVGENDAGKLVPTTDPVRALRHYHPDVALKLAEEAGKQLEHECCVARRLTTDWEVAE